MHRVLVILLIFSQVFTGAAVATGIDAGVPNCHNNHQAAAGNQPDPDGHLPHTGNQPDSDDHLPQMQAVCDCDCPCCNYAAHLIPIACLPTLVAQTAPRTAVFALRQYAYSSYQYPPPTPPPIT